MAVPFCLPDPNPEDHAGGNGGASQPVSGSSSTMQSPLLSPVNDALFVQAFYEALYRCTQGGLPETPMSPTSPNQDGCGHNSRFYFPQRTPMSPMSPVTPVSPVARSRIIVPQRVYVPRRIRLSSLSDDDSDMYEDVIIEYASDSDDNESNQNERDLMIHLRHMEAREQMQMFQGRVPPPKKSDRRKTEASSSSCNVRNNNIKSNRKISNQDDKPKQKDSFRWPTVVTAVVLAVGCGILVSR